MGNIKITFLLLATFFAVSLSAQKVSITSVNCLEFNKGINGADVIILDVNSEEIYKSGHIKGAVNIAVSDLKFLDKVHVQIPKNKIIYIYDNSDKKSTTVAQFLKYQDYKRFVILKGGLTAWKLEGFDIEM